MEIMQILDSLKIPTSILRFILNFFCARSTYLAVHSSVKAESDIYIYV